MTTEPLSSDVLRIAFSKAELEAHARQYMLDNFGRPADSNDRDQWYERFGLLVHFVSEVMSNPVSPERLHV
jgi:hypothetical protein